jgi:hypothetical protein
MIQIWEQKENLGKIHKRICAGFLSFVYTCIYTKMYCCLRSSYQEGRVGISTTFFSLSQARTWISNVICHGLFCVQWVQLRWEVIVDNGGIDDYHCLNFLCTTESMFLFILKVVPIRYFQLSQSLLTATVKESWVGMKNWVFCTHTYAEQVQQGYSILFI